MCYYSIFELNFSQQKTENRLTLNRHNRIFTTVLVHLLTFYKCDVVL